MSSINEQYQEYQRLMLEHPRANVFDTKNQNGLLFERLHIDRPVAFGAVLRRTARVPVFEFLIPESTLQ